LTTERNEQGQHSPYHLFTHDVTQKYHPIHIHHQTSQRHMTSDITEAYDIRHHRGI
ncbi:hypothetical protein Bpfe_029317, partial [Biomphalaria pfeifferi]